MAIISGYVDDLNNLYRVDKDSNSLIEFCAKSSARVLTNSVFGIIAVIETVAKATLTFLALSLFPVYQAPFYFLSESTKLSAETVVKALKGIGGYYADSIDQLPAAVEEKPSTVRLDAEKPIKSVKEKEVEKTSKDDFITLEGLEPLENQVRWMFRGLLGICLFQNIDMLVYSNYDLRTFALKGARSAVFSHKELGLFVSAICISRLLVHFIERLDDVPKKNKSFWESHKLVTDIAQGLFLGLGAYGYCAIAPNGFLGFETFLVNICVNWETPIGVLLEPAKLYIEGVTKVFKRVMGYSCPIDPLQTKEKVIKILKMAVGLGPLLMAVEAYPWIKNRIISAIPKKVTELELPNVLKPIVQEKVIADIPKKAAELPKVLKTIVQEKVIQEIPKKGAELPQKIKTIVQEKVLADIPKKEAVVAPISASEMTGSAFFQPKVALWLGAAILVSYVCYKYLWPALSRNRNQNFKQPLLKDLPVRERIANGGEFALEDDNGIAFRQFCPNPIEDPVEMERLPDRIPLEFENDIHYPQFICGISYELICDPVLDPNGITLYERRNIYHWLARNQTSPMTRAPLRIEDLVEVPNIARFIKMKLFEHRRRIEPLELEERRRRIEPLELEERRRQLEQFEFESEIEDINGRKFREFCPGPIEDPIEVDLLPDEIPAEFENDRHYPQFRCPISLQLIRYPVLDPTDRRTLFEYSQIVNELEGNPRSPITRAPLNIDGLIPVPYISRFIKSKLYEYQQRQRED